MSSVIRIGSREIGTGSPCLIVGEVGQNHDGSLGLAHAHIDAIADAGADAVKFQTHIAEAESTRHETFRIRFSMQDATRIDYWKRMEFSAEQWQGLADHAAERALIFLSSPFSMAALDLLQSIGVPAWKVGSGEVCNLPMLRRMAATSKPILLSSGMSSWKELDESVALLRTLGAPFLVMQCTTEYPCPPAHAGLNLIPVIQQRYGCPVGFSDHTGEIFASLAAVVLGASVIETHTSIDKRMFGPDLAAGIDVDQFGELVRGARFLENAIAQPENKDKRAMALAHVRDLFTKSVVPVADLQGGTVLSESHVTVKKPGTGIPAKRLESLYGRRLNRDVKADELIRETDLE